MGRVYLAEDTKLHRKVSLKFLSSSFSEEAQRLRRFEQEARAASALNHPNILTIHEIGEADDGRRFIATEYIDGQTLRDRLRSQLDIDDALEIAIQVASALVAAHKANIVHRDIKPENIMIRGEDGLVKVLDFGLAKTRESSLPKRRRLKVDIDATTQFKTAPGVVMGTLAYMSPEQARGETVDERADIWSLGVVVYEMVAGSSPFAAGTANEIISSILSKQEAPRLGRYSRSVPERLEEIVEKALTKNRDERYQTCRDLLIDLKRLKRALDTHDAIKLSQSQKGQSNEIESSPPERVQEVKKPESCSSCGTDGSDFGDSNGRVHLLVALERNSCTERTGDQIAGRAASQVFGDGRELSGIRNRRRRDSQDQSNREGDCPTYKCCAALPERGDGRTHGCETVGSRFGA